MSSMQRHMVLLQLSLQTHAGEISKIFWLKFWHFGHFNEAVIIQIVLHLSERFDAKLIDVKATAKIQMFNASRA